MSDLSQLAGVEGAEQLARAAATAPPPPPAPVQPPATGGPVEVTLGRHTIPVYPQSIPYLERRLGKTIMGYVDRATEQQEDLSADSFLRFLGDGIYGALSALIPALPKRMPEFEWHGHFSQEAADRGDEIEEDNPGATWPQVVHAAETVWKVNRFDVLGHIGKLLDPTMLKPALTNRIRLELATRGLESPSSSPSRSGTSPQQRPSGTDRTPSASGGSPFPASSFSPTPTPADGSLS